MDGTIKQEAEPDLEWIPRGQWFEWFVMACLVAASALVAAAAWDIWR